MFHWDVLCVRFQIYYVELIRISENVGVTIGIFLAWSTHCVSCGVGRRKNLSSVFIRWALVIVLSRKRVRVTGNLIKS